MKKKTPVVMTEERYFLITETNKNGIDSLCFDKGNYYPHHKKEKDSSCPDQSEILANTEEDRDASHFNTRDRLLLSKQSRKTPPVHEDK
jgi:hypothetical protein